MESESKKLSLESLQISIDVFTSIKSAYSSIVSSISSIWDWEKYFLNFGLAILC
jgi:hypothetical protein